MAPGRWMATAALAAVMVARAAGGDLPRPGIGVFFRADEAAALREKVQKPPCKAIYEQLLKRANEALAKWPEDKAKLRFEELMPKLPDIQTEFVPKEFLPEGGKEAGMALGNYGKDGAPAAAFVYLITGERKYADFAWEVFELCAKANRWGWFPWSGSHMPQIHFGILSRGLVLVADCVWDTLTPAQRQLAREAIADKCVEPYFRIVLHTPGMGLFHLRSLNQGNNALAAALIGSIFVGGTSPSRNTRRGDMPPTMEDNRIWFNSLLQTFHWAITHDIGWMGQHLESGLGGYWSVSMQNLYTAAAALWNVRGIDLRPHPGFDQATYYPIIHETTVPAVNQFTEPIDPLSKALPGIISGKPIELPHGGRCGAWWLDYAAKFPDSPAHYFVRKEMVTPDRLNVADAHQGALGQVLGIAWWDDKLLADPKPPTSLAQFTDRMAGIRSGYGLGQTYLYFNGDLFLSAKNEILCTTSGMSWHFPWHQYQIAETGIETEGEPFAPSMIIKESYNDERFAYFRAESGFSNVAYYPRPGQRESHTHYDKRERSILYVRPADDAPDYFVFSDVVRHKDEKPRWHAWTWHLWNHAENSKNFGRFVPLGDNAVRAERPNADLYIKFLTPDKLAFEQHGVPSQPCVSYQMDHNGQMLRAIAGGYEPTDAKPVTIPPSAWRALAPNLPKVPNLREVKLDDAPDVPAFLHLSPPPTEKTVTSEVVKGLTGGIRYRASLKCKEANYRVYEATAWEIGLELLDKDGKAIAKPETPYGHPDPLKLGAPKSDIKTHDWTETVSYFDAPEGAIACRASFRAVGSAHYFTLGELWFGEIKLEPVGKPHREREQRFLTIVMPLAKNAKPPELKMTEKGILALFPDPAKKGGASALTTNSDANAKQLLAGLKPVLDQLAAERDAVTSKGRKNLALDAKVTASASRDERFPPSKVIDNQVAEYPLDGHLDYTLGIVWTSSRFAGYGSGKESLLDNRDYFPLYVKPTYWLLPENTLGHVELKLKEPAAVDLVRLLNTSNAGLNDFAAHTFRVELYSSDRKLLSWKEDAFGKVFDRPFQHAFFAPKWFSRYTPTFAGMLEPGVTVPFGDGWKEIAFGDVKGVKLVRVVLTKFWGIGGGLNEVQVYGR
ncbi:MAG TPA: hypothetical protein PLE19_00390 [Planctomycetota bacterium]|nr:hypothetical protein [Planctomycetota bacterium]HRT97015.1 hypothetical protein [Planctomycetota bacterium]